MYLVSDSLLAYKVPFTILILLHVLYMLRNNSFPVALKDRLFLE